MSVLGGVAVAIWGLLLNLPHPVVAVVGLVSFGAFIWIIAGIMWLRTKVPLKRGANQAPTSIIHSLRPDGPLLFATINHRGHNIQASCVVELGFINDSDHDLKVWAAEVDVEFSRSEHFAIPCQIVCWVVGTEGLSLKEIEFPITLESRTTPIESKYRFIFIHELYIDPKCFGKGPKKTICLRVTGLKSPTLRCRFHSNVRWQTGS